MTKIVGFTELAYGADYLEVALESVVPYVDGYYVAYTGRPLNRPNPYVCPDSRDALREIAHEVCKRHNTTLTWYDNPGTWGRYDQRNSIFGVATDADVIILTDADEVWGTGAILDIIDRVVNGNTRYYRVPVRYFWRSFDHVCYQRSDIKSFPLRVFNLSVGGNTGDSGEPSTVIGDQGFPLNEFGFARAPRDFLYKIPSHGHFAGAMSWFETLWLPWTPASGQMECVYPGNPGRFPTVTKFDKTKLPQHLSQHRYYNECVIGGNNWPTDLKKIE